MHRATPTTVLLLGLALAGCGGPAASDPDAGAADAAPPEASVRGNRYCEVLPAYLEGDTIRAEVWGTQGLSDCPLEAWYALDAEALRAELGATRVIMNGPRHWVLDRVEAVSLPDAPRRTFGTLEMRQFATLRLPLAVAMSGGPYEERTIERDTRFAFFAGTEVYELVAPGGETYVMQSLANIVDSELDESDLPGLGARLTPPAGWTYRVRTLDAELELRAEGTATVLQDELQNTYQRM
jgi:hypothetical protein